MSTTASEAYRELRLRVSPMVLSVGDRAATMAVPACPDWSVKDVVAHLSGICADILAGNLEGVASDPWTAAQVEARRELTVAEVVGEWNELGPKVEELFVGLPGAPANQLVFDALSHEYDLCEALGLPSPDRVQAEGPALDFAMAGLVGMARHRGVPAFRVTAGDRHWDIPGEGEPAHLITTTVDLLRSLTGRRTRGEVAALDWNGADPTPYLAAFEFGPFRFRDNPVKP